MTMWLHKNYSSTTTEWQVTGQSALSIFTNRNEKEEKNNDKNKSHEWEKKTVSTNEKSAIGSNVSCTCFRFLLRSNTFIHVFVRHLSRSSINTCSARAFRHVTRRRCVTWLPEVSSWMTSSDNAVGRDCWYGCRSWRVTCAVADNVLLAATCNALVRLHYRGHASVVVRAEVT